MEVNVSEETFLLGNIASSFVILLRKKRIRAAAPNTGEVPPVSNDGETHFVCVYRGRRVRQLGDFLWKRVYARKSTPKK